MRGCSSVAYSCDFMVCFAVFDVFLSKPQLLESCEPFNQNVQSWVPKLKLLNSYLGTAVKTYELLQVGDYSAQHLWKEKLLI